MKKITLLLLIIGAVNAYSQGEFQVELDLGRAFQEEMMLNGEKLPNKSAFGMRVGINYVKVLKRELYMETGLYGKYNRTNNSMETLSYTSNSLKLQVPLYVGYKVNEKWKFSFGASIENNKDFDRFHTQKEDDLRFDLLAKVVYVYNTKMQFSFYTNSMLNTTAGIYTLSSPKNGIYFGVIYQLGTREKTKTDKL